MCLRVCLVLHALCGVAFTGAGSVLMVAGIFFFLSSPFLQLGSNMLTGGLCIVFGVGSVILTCCGARDLDSSRVDKLLGCTLFVLAAGVANIVVLEVGEWWMLYNEDLKYVIALHQMEDLAFYGHLVPSVTTCLVIAVAFLDAQFLYCAYNLRKAPRVRHVHVNEAVSDIEYIIPRHKTRSINSKQAQVQSLTQYTQSWVFDTEGSSQAESPYLKLPPATASSDLPRRHRPPPSPIVSVQVDSGSEDSPEVGRQLHHMQSFSRVHSRTHSPGDGDASQLSSSTSVSTSQPPIYECLERLTQPSLYKSRLDTFHSESDATRPGSARSDYRQGPQGDPSHASLIAELGRSISHKQSFDTRSRGSDADFSMELEAALKLIQDLESPNTIETPSETFRGFADVRVERTPGSGNSSKTLSGHSSLDGKLATRTCGPGLAADSLSTSGYNSPAVSERGTLGLGGSMACVIRQVGSTAVISIFPASAPGSPVARSEPTPSFGHRRRTHVRTLSADTKLTPEGGRLRAALGKVCGILGGRRPSASLAPDLERAVLKSESLAFLTDCQLEDRLQQTRDVHRRIEAKVKRDMLVRRSAR